MSASIVGTEVARPFLPSRDFALSTRFYEALGFEKLLDSDVAIFRIGRGEFLLQRRYVKDWAENAMMQLMVDDLDQWWNGAPSRVRGGSSRRALARRATATGHETRLSLNEVRLGCL